MSMVRIGVQAKTAALPWPQSEEINPNPRWLAMRIGGYILLITPIREMLKIRRSREFQHGKIVRATVNIDRARQNLAMRQAMRMQM